MAVETDDKVYKLELSPNAETLVEWLKQYGRELTADELNRLVHYKNQSLPKDLFIVWANQPLMGRHSGWILKDVTSVRILWHSLGEKRGSEGWYYVQRTLALPFTDAPVF